MQWFSSSLYSRLVDGPPGYGAEIGGEFPPASVAQGVESDGAVAAFGSLKQATPLQGVEAELAIAARSRQNLTAAAFHAAHKFRTF